MTLTLSWCQLNKNQDDNSLSLQRVVAFLQKTCDLFLLCDCVLCHHVFHVLFMRFMLFICIVYGDEHFWLCQIKYFDFDFDKIIVNKIVYTSLT